MTLSEEALEDGREFIQIFSGVILAGETLDCVTEFDSDYTIYEASIVGNTEVLEWQTFAGVQFTEGTGTEIPPNPRNSFVSVDPQYTLIKDPTITSDGVATISDPIQIIGLTAAGNRNYIDNKMIRSPFRLSKDFNYNLRVTNTSSDACDYTIEFYFRKQPPYAT